jgi:hypothetical protein
MSWKDRRIESAAIDVTDHAHRGLLCVRSCDPMDINDVSRAVVEMANLFGPGRIFLDPNDKHAAAQYLRKLATLLGAHLS